MEPLEKTGAPASPGTDPARRAITGAVIGVTAVVLAVSMLVQNVMFGVTEAPGYGDAIAEVFDWHAHNRLTVAIAVAAEALHALLLLGFLVGLHGLVIRRGGAGGRWSLLAVAAGATLSSVYAVYSVSWIATVLAVGERTEPSPAFELAWQLHAAAFATALPVLGLTVITAALAGSASRLTPRWQVVLGIAGGTLLLATGAATLEIAAGSALLFVGLPGLAAWIVWLLATGIRLVRSPAADGPVTASPTRKKKR